MTEIVAQLIISGVTIVVSTAISTIIPTLIKRSFEKYFKQKDEAAQKQKQNLLEYEEMKEKERRDKIVEEIESSLKESLTPVLESLELLKKGEQASLRSQLQECYNEWYPKKYCPDEIKREFENMYMSYHNLGKNGIMDSKREKLMQLPEYIETKKTRKSKSKNEKN